MAWISVDKDGDERIFEIEPQRNLENYGWGGERVDLPKGSIQKLIGRELKWEDEPVELKEDE